MRNDSERLRDILEAIEKIERYASKGRMSFEQDELIQTWIIHNLEVIGEACRTLSPTIIEKHSEINWRKIIGMRNILAHHYFEVDYDVLWAVVEKDLPEMKQKLVQILNEI